MKKKLIIILSIIICFSTSFYIHAEETTLESDESLYKDLKSTHWAYNAISDMSDKGILSGLPDGTFGVNNPITKEAFATMLVKSFDLKEISPIKATFEDVVNEKWSYKYVETVKKYVKCENKDEKLYFKPKENITRENMIASLVLLLGLSDETVDLAVLDKFQDKDDISQDIRGLISIGIAHQMINGDGKNINPKKELTRAEASLIIYNILQKEYEVENKFDSSFGIKNVMYNDGYIKFIYPIEYVSSNTKLKEDIIENDKMKSYHLEKDKMNISLYYTLDPNSTSYAQGRGIGTNALTDIMKYLNRGPYTEYEKNNYNNNYILMNYTSDYGDKVFIFGRGIDNMIPQIVISGDDKYDFNGTIAIKTEGEIFNENKVIMDVCNIIRDSFKVVSNIKSFKSPGLDKNVMETYPIDGQNDVETDLTCEIRCNAQIGWGSKYSFKDEDGNVIDNIDIYFATSKNILKIRFGQELEHGKTYILEPEILNDIDGNYVNASSIKFTTKID